MRRSTSGRGTEGADAPPQRSPTFDPNKMPRVIRNNKYCCKFGYLAAHALFLWMLFSIPNSFLNEPGMVATVVVLLCATFATYFVLQASDPGYLTEELVGEASRTAATSPALLTQPDELDADAMEAGETKSGALDVDEDEVEIDLTRLEAERAPLDASQYCTRCKFDQPIRAKHCRDCDRCVARFDHHCIVLGTCIGERNHARFFAFLFAQMVTIAVGISIAHSGFEHRENDWWSYNSYSIASTVLLWVCQAFVFPLLLWHTWLAATNGTSREFIKNDKLWYLNGYRECDLPFSQGLSTNIQTFCCVDGLWSRLLGMKWRPTVHQIPPASMYDRESHDVCSNIWENAYWSCC